MSKHFLFMLFLMPVFGLADDSAKINGPVAGYVYDRASHAIRPILGVPGSAYLGSALASDADAGSIAPDASAALVVLQGRLHITNGIKTLSPEWTALDGALANAELFAWSETAAAVYSSKTGHAQIIREVAKAPVASAEMDLSALPGTVAAIALAGDTLLVAVEGGVYRMDPDNGAQLLAAAQRPVSLAVRGGDLYFADRDGGSIWLVANFIRGAAPAIFLGGIDGPVGISINDTRMGTQLFVASAGGRQLSSYDLRTGAVSRTFDLDFSPDALEPMGSRAQLLMARGKAGEQPYYVLDLSQDPAVYFVPAGSEQQ